MFSNLQSQLLVTDYSFLFFQLLYLDWFLKLLLLCLKEVILFFLQYWLTRRLKDYSWEFKWSTCLRITSCWNIIRLFFSFRILLSISWRVFLLCCFLFLNKIIFNFNNMLFHKFIEGYSRCVCAFSLLYLRWKSKNLTFFFLICF